MTQQHSFHIPVMGIGFTVDTPLKVSPYGIDSVVSLVDDGLMEKMREMYCQRFDLPFEPIGQKDEDHRARRITAYLNVLNLLSARRFEEIVSGQAEEEVKKCIALLPENSPLKAEYHHLVSTGAPRSELSTWLRANLKRGSIDVNIMTKIDKENHDDNGDVMPMEFNDAQAALRGYAKSDLESAIVFSAGMNPAIYGYAEQFEDFYPDANGYIRKKIIIKVSDYRSALIQGNFFAKKGIWVSEYRIESGLNCGGHAFPTEGHLLGPILAAFRDQRKDLMDSIHELLVKGLGYKNRPIPAGILPVKISAQGGVGTNEEHEFLLSHYDIDSVGWGSPFLLVPEATAIDEATVQLLADAGENELYLSDVSPMGVPFNNVRNNTKDLEKEARIREGKPGSPCSKTYISFNKEFTKQGICMASRQFQKLKIEQLDTLNLPSAQYDSEYRKIVSKSCICVGLGTAALLQNNLNTHPGGDGVSVCPGPNLAYFNRRMSLLEMTDHIYGRTNVITRTDRPHVFVKELSLYMDFLRNSVSEAHVSVNNNQVKFLQNYVKNLSEGNQYYQNLFESIKDKFETTKQNIIAYLEENLQALQSFKIELEGLKVACI